MTQAATTRRKCSSEQILGLGAVFPCSRVLSGRAAQGLISPLLLADSAKEWLWHD